jgi:hypothetical protein
MSDIESISKLLSAPLLVTNTDSLKSTEITQKYNQELSDQFGKLQRLYSRFKEQKAMKDHEAPHPDWTHREYARWESRRIDDYFTTDLKELTQNIKSILEKIAKENLPLSAGLREHGLEVIRAIS